MEKTDKINKTSLNSIHWARFCAVAVFLIGLLVFMGWVLDIPIIVMTAKLNPIISSTIIPKSILIKPHMLDLLLGTVECHILK